MNRNHSYLSNFKLWPLQAKSWHWNILFIAILLSHLILKFSTLSLMEVQGDEAFSIFFSQQSVGELLARLNLEANPPFFYLVLNGWIHLFGISPFATKSLIVLMSVITAILIFLLGKQAKSFVFTLFASGCYLVSNLHFDFSHEIRAFQLVLVLTLTSYLFLIRYLEYDYHGDWKTHITSHFGTLAVIALCTAALPFTHYNAVLVPLSQFIVTLFFIQKNKKKTLILWGTWAAAALLFFPQLMVFKSAVPDENFWLGLSSWSDLSYIHLKLVGNDPSYYFVMIPFYLSPFLAIIFTRLNWMNPTFSLRTFSLFWCLFPIPLLLNFWIAQHIPSFQLRYLLFANFGIYLSLGYFFSAFRRLKFIGWAVLFGIFVHLALDFLPAKREGEGWKETAETLHHFKTRDALILVNATFKLRDLMYYFDRDIFADYSHFHVKSRNKSVVSVYHVNEVKSLGNLHRFKKVILVLSHSDNEDPNGLIPKYLDTTLNFCYEIGDAFRPRIRVYSSASQPCVEYRTVKSSSCKKEDWGFWRYSSIIEKLSGTFIDQYSMVKTAKNAYIVSPQVAFSPSRERPVSAVRLVDCFCSFSALEAPKAVLVVSVEKNQQFYKRAEYPLAKYFRNGKGKLDIKSSVLGNYPRGARVKVYIWNPSGTNVKIEALTIGFWKK
jgi:uncharacterized membrane protein